MAAPYRTEIEKLIEKARNRAETLQESHVELQNQRGDALEEFADTLESAIDELDSGWEASNG